VISTAFIESLVNSLLANASQEAIHAVDAQRLLQIRTRTLNGDLAPTFCPSYPDFTVADYPIQPDFLAA
jgi:hypothetical protein